MKKNFTVGKQEIEVLKGIDLTINKGDFAILFGPSGCGKSTLVHTILGMEKPTGGKIIIEGKDLYGMDEDNITRYRKTKIGIVFQESIWVKSLNVIENISLPNRLKGMDKEKAEKMGMDLLKKVKLEDWAYYHPNELSSGQQQRVSLSRALSVDPLLIVADEPTGNLDTVSGDALMGLLKSLSKDEGKTILMITHDLEYLKYANRLFHIIDGLLAEESDGKNAEELVKKMGTKKGKRKGVTVRDKNYLTKNEDN